MEHRASTQRTNADFISVGVMNQGGRSEVGRCEQKCLHKLNSREDSKENPIAEGLA